jgi:hypothetical protein
MSASYEEAMRKANGIREELIRREDNPPQVWEIEQCPGIQCSDFAV